ncbi:Dps family protein [Flavobacterium sp.]|uniref:Dps family protein n=1 Tax=Flavobacterium sp. TaxID=239 RepID=UPI003BEC4810
MKTNIGITDKNSQLVVDQLARILADEYVLYTKTKNAHWNVEGADFYEKHKFFEMLYIQLEEFTDKIAERIRTLGFYTPATLASFLNLTQLTEFSREKNDSNGFIKELLMDHESIILKLRGSINSFATDYKDLGSSDFITGLMEEHEKMAWLLRSHL